MAKHQVQKGHIISKYINFCSKQN